LAGVSYVLWPNPEKGPVTQTGIVQLSYTISGATTYPGVIDLNIKITNMDSLTHDFVILAVIGSETGRVWYGPGFYMDYLSPATDVQISDPWYKEAFVSTGPLKPGQTYQVTRKIEVPNYSLITDALVSVRDRLDPSNALAWEVERNVIKW
jgi:hypothetical protein